MRSSNQKERLSKLKQGEGTFVYLGGAFDTESIPGIPMLGKDGNQLRSVVFTTVEDSMGNKVQVVDPRSSERGELVWKRAPQFKRTPIEVFKLPVPGVPAEHTEIADVEIMGKRQPVRLPSLTAKPSSDGKTRALYLEFAKGSPVFVGSPAMALKLRCLSFFKEVVADTAEAKAETKKLKAEDKGAKA